MRLTASSEWCRTWRRHFQSGAPTYNISCDHSSTACELKLHFMAIFCLQFLSNLPDSISYQDLGRRRDFREFRSRPFPLPSYIPIQTHPARRIRLRVPARHFNFGTNRQISGQRMVVGAVIHRRRRGLGGLGMMYTLVLSRQPFLMVSSSSSSDPIRRRYGRERIVLP